MAVEIIVLGVGATLLMDLWALARKRWFGVAALDYAWVGRWLGHMRHGQFRHAAIGKARRCIEIFIAILDDCVIIPTPRLTLIPPCWSGQSKTPSR